MAREKEGGRAHYWNKSRNNESTINAISNHERTFKKNKKSEDEKCADAAGGWAMQSSVAISLLYNGIFRFFYNFGDFAQET